MRVWLALCALNLVTLVTFHTELSVGGGIAVSVAVLAAFMAGTHFNKE